MVGGPTVPVFTEKLVEGRSPLLLVVTSLPRGLVHETGTSFPRKLTVGCDASLLHSMIPPSELSEKPDPDTETLWPFVRSVDGVTDKVPGGASALGENEYPQLQPRARELLRPWLCHVIAFDFALTMPPKAS